jgi:hypothetical protein
VPSTRFDDTGASVTASLASCQDAASEAQQRREGRQQVVFVGAASRVRQIGVGTPHPQGL